ELVQHDLGCECPFPGKCARIAGDVVGGPSVAVLDRNLHMVEPSLSQCVEGLVRDPDRGGDQIGVKAGRMGTVGDVDEIAPRTGLAARQPCKEIRKHKNNGRGHDCQRCGFAGGSLCASSGHSLSTTARISSDTTVTFSILSMYLCNRRRSAGVITLRPTMRGKWRR